MQRLAKGRTEPIAAVSANKSVAAFARGARSSEHGAGAPRRQPQERYANYAPRYRPLMWRRFL
jgi:hypothetical protein